MAIYGDFVRFGYSDLVMALRFDFFFDLCFLARVLFRCFFYRRHDVSSDDEESEVAEEEGDTERMSIALLRVCSFSNLTFEFFATII